MEITDRDAYLSDLHLKAIEIVNLRSKAKGAEKRALTKAMHEAYDLHRSELRRLTAR